MSHLDPVSESPSSAAPESTNDRRGQFLAAGLLRRLLDRIFGYDYFISYAHADGREYPQHLRDRLEAGGFRAFLDTQGYVAGDDLRSSTRRRVRMSSYLVVVARPHALKSKWVRSELDASTEARRVSVVINVNNAMADLNADPAILRHLQDRLYIAETLAGEGNVPSDHVLAELHRTFTATRQESRRLSFLALVAVTLAILSVWLIVQSIRIVRQNRAISSQLAAGQFAASLLESEEHGDLAAAALKAVSAVESAPDGDQQAPVYLSRAISLASQLPLHRVVDGPIHKATFDATLDHLAVVSDRQLYIWDVNTGNAWSPPLRGDGVRPEVGDLSAPCFSPDGRIVTATIEEPQPGGGALASHHTWEVGNDRPAKYGDFHGTLAQWNSLLVSTDNKSVLLPEKIDAGYGLQVVDRASGKHRYADLVSKLPFDQKTLCHAPNRAWAVLVEQRAIRIVDLTTGQPVSTGSAAIAHPGPVLSVRISSDGSRVATLARDEANERYVLQLFDAQTGIPLDRASNNPVATSSEPLSIYDIDPGGRRILTVSESGRTAVWDSETGNAQGFPEIAVSPWQRLSRSLLGGQAVAFAAAGDLLVTLSGFTFIETPEGRDFTQSSDRYYVDVWGTASGQRVFRRLELPGTVEALAVSRDGRRLGIALRNGEIDVWELVKDSSQRIASDNVTRERRLVAAAFSPDRSTVLTASGMIPSSDSHEGGEILLQLRERQSARVIWSRPVESASELLADCQLRFGSAGRHVAIFIGSEVQVWNAKGEAIAGGVIQVDGTLQDVFIKDDGCVVKVAAQNETEGDGLPWVQQWQPANGRFVAQPQRQIGHAIHGPDNRPVIDAATGQEVTPVILGFSGTGEQAVVAASPGAYAYYKQRQTLRFGQRRIVGVCTAAHAGPYRSLEVHSISSKNMLNVRPVNFPATAGATSVIIAAMLRQGSATTEGDRIRVRPTVGAAVWKLPTGTDAQSIFPVTPPAELFLTDPPLRYSPDGRWFAGVRINGREVRVWEATTGRPVTEPLWHEGAVLDIAFASDGCSLLTMDDQATVRNWYVRTAAAGKPGWLGPLVQSLTGRRLVANGVITPLSGTDRAAASSMLRRTLTAYPEDDGVRFVQTWLRLP